VAYGRFNKVTGILLILATSSLVFCAGAYLGKAIFEPQASIDHEMQTVETVVDEPVEKVRVEHVETAKTLRNFQNLDELEQWLGNIGVLDISFNVVDQETGQHIQTFDCEDYAIRLQEKALSDGYIMSFGVIRSTEYNALFKQKRIPADKIHAINSVILGNEVYYIEPQTHEIVFVAYLD